MRARAAAVIALVLAAVPPCADAAAQPTLDACLAGAGLRDRDAFLRFDEEFRTALTTRDGATVAVLASYPLRVNAGRRGTFSIDGPAALQARFDEIFPAAVRSAVDIDSKGLVRYRAWNKPRLLKSPPDLRIASGTKDYEGTGAGSTPVWRFTTGATTITLTGRGGCTDAPTGSAGALRVSRSGKLVQELTCY